MPPNPRPTFRCGCQRTLENTYRRKDHRRGLGYYETCKVCDRASRARYVGSPKGREKHREWEAARRNETVQGFLYYERYNIARRGM